MKKLMHIMLLVFCVIFIAACNNGEHEGKVYETSVGFIATKISGVVGDEFFLNSLIVLKPYNANLAKIEISDENVASFVENESKIVCLSEGEATITAKVNCEVNGERCASFTLSVSQKAIYANQLNFENENLQLNFNETATNVSTFTLSSGETVSYENYEHKLNQEEVQVSYSSVGLISYDPISGQITPLVNTLSELPKSANITVLVKYASGAATRKTSTFNVTLTNFVYANDIVLENEKITFSRDENNVWQSNTVKMFTNSQLNLGYSLVPNNSNMLPELTAMSEDILVSDGIIYAGNTAQKNLVVKLSIKNSKNTILEKYINLEVVAPHKSVEILLTNAHQEPITNVFVGEGAAYFLHINTNGSDRSVLQPYFNEIEYKEFYYLQATENENVYRIIFTTADTAGEKIILRAQNDSFAQNSVVFSNAISINVFETTGEFNLAATSGDKALAKQNGNYLLKAINKEYANDARLASVPFEAKLVPITSGTNVLANNYDIFVGFEGNFIKVVSNFENELLKMTVTQEGIFVESNNSGAFILRIKSKDFKGNYTDFGFVVESTKITEFRYDNAPITNFKLFSNTSVESAKTLNLSSFSHYPTYAHLNTYAFEAGNNCVEINNNKITAKAAGNVEITISAQGLKQTFLIKVVANVDSAVAQINDISCENDQPLVYTTSQLDEQLCIIFSAFADGETLSDFTLTYVFIDNDGHEMQTSHVVSKCSANYENKICFVVLDYGTQAVKYFVTSGLSVVEGLININVESEFANITGLKFEKNEKTLRVNLFESAQVANGLIILSDNENKPVDMTKISVISTNSEINVDIYGNITSDYLRIGTVLEHEITAQIIARVINNSYFEAEYTLVLYYKEPDKFIENITFENNNFEVNAFECDEFSNKHLITYTDNHYTCFDTVEFSVSENDYVSIDKTTGEITVLNAVAGMQSQQITVFASVQSTRGTSVYSYDFTLYWQKTVANITNIEFLEDNFEINANETDDKVVEFKISYDNTFECFDTVGVFSSLPNFVNCEIVDNSVRLTFKNADQLVARESVTIRLVVNGQSEFTFTFDLFYELNFDDINKLETEWSSKTANATTSEEVVFENALILNDGQPGNYNFSEINVSTNNDSFVVKYENGRIVVTSTVAESAIITLNVNDLSITFEVKITNFIEITTQNGLEELSGKSGNYIITTSLNINANFSPIENFSGYLTAAEGVVITTDSILFYVNEGVIENLKVVAAFDKVFDGKFDIDGEKYEDEYAGFVLINNGTINNVNLQLTVSTQVQNVGGFVYENYGVITNSSIIINFTNSGAKSNLGAFAYKNVGEISHCNVLEGSVLTHYKLAAGFVYENYSEISYSTTSISFYGFGDSRQAGFVALSKENSSYSYCTADINYYDVQAGRTYGFEYFGSSKIENCLMLVNNYWDELPDFANTGSQVINSECRFKEEE